MNQVTSKRCACIWADSSRFTAEQVKTAILEFRARLPEPYCNSHLDFNIPTDKDTKKFLGFGYVFFEHPQVINLMIGLSEDGKPLVKKIDDPDYTPSDEPVKAVKNPNSTAWGDMEDDDDFFGPVAKKVPQIEVKIPPPYDLPHIITHNEETKEEEKAYLTVDYCVGNNPPEKADRNILRYRNASDIVSVKDIKKKMSLFATDTVGVTECRFKGKTLKGSYPFVFEFTSHGSRDIVVVFDSRYNDAVFAKTMCKFYVHRDEKTGQTCDVQFSHNIRPRPRENH
jgi:hypothetical protein